MGVKASKKISTKHEITKHSRNYSIGKIVGQMSPFKMNLGGTIKRPESLDEVSQNGVQKRGRKNTAEHSHSVFELYSSIEVLSWGMESTAGRVPPKTVTPFSSCEANLVRWSLLEYTSLYTYLHCKLTLV